MGLVPVISVVMPVHNAMPYIDVSIASILNQSFSNFELVIRDDGSNDGSGECLRAWARRDTRIRLFHGERLGPAASSNWVIGQARATIIARMDADDFARPDRLSRQLEILETAKDALLVSSLSETMNAQGRRVRNVEYWRLARKSCFVPFPHASIMLRKAVFEAVGGYRAQCDWWEDLDLFLRLAALGRIIVIAEPLIVYRQSLASTRLTSDRSRVEHSIDRMYRCLSLHVRGFAYDHLLEPEDTPPGNRKLHPRTFITYGLSQLWSGQRPRLMKRAYHGARLGFNLVSAQCLVWAAWATLHPGSLRRFLKLLLRIRNHTIFHGISKHRLYEWQPILGGTAIAHHGLAPRARYSSPHTISDAPHAHTL